MRIIYICMNYVYKEAIYYFEDESFLEYVYLCAYSLLCLHFPYDACFVLFLSSICTCMALKWGINVIVLVA